VRFHLRFHASIAPTSCFVRFRLRLHA